MLGAKKAQTLWPAWQERRGSVRASTEQFDVLQMRSFKTPYRYAAEDGL
jgi:hypothetical protein